ncbi:acyl--CoA ligase [Frankia sp. CH37]|nr:acyl--CoA ligase [Parafrankia sp. CH37]
MRGAPEPPVQPERSPPLLSNQEIHEALCAPGQFFEWETVEVRGVPTRTWKNAPRNLGAVLAQGAAAGGSRDFIVLGEERISHVRHLQLVEALAASLVDELGVRKGDRVAIAMRNIPEWSIAFFAAARVGAVAVALNSFGNGAELAYTLDDSAATVVIADGERIERLATVAGALDGRTVIGTRLDDRKGTADLPAGILPFSALTEREHGPVDVDVEPDDLATIFYTSGSTANPKGVVGTHRNACANLMNMMFVGARTMQRDATPSATPAGPTVQMLSVPLFHATGCHATLVGTAAFGGTLVLIRRWDAEVALDLMERERVTSFSGVPTMLWDLLNAPSVDRRDLSALQRFGGGGAASPPALSRRIRERFPTVIAATGYGLTETSALTTSINGSDYQNRPASVGAPVPVAEVRIVGDDGSDVQPGDSGEIWVRGPNVCAGYWSRTELAAVPFEDGWLRSGDLGRFDDEGFLYIVDRLKDIVIRGGENISTLEVEAALMEHPAVLEATVFAVGHPTLGEEVGAVVHVAAGSPSTADDLRAHVGTLLAAHKVPAHVWLSAEPLPRSDTGKLLKRAIRATYSPLAGSA